jgi:hypothetical protein
MPTRGLMLEKATNEATINLLRQDLVAHKSHMQTLAKRFDRVHFDVESKCEVLSKLINANLGVELPEFVKLSYE